MDIPVMLSRIAGVVIVILGLVLGWRVGLGIGGTWWMFLNTTLLYVACGVLIMVAADIANKLGNKNN